MKYEIGQKVKYFPVLGKSDFIETTVNSHEVLVCGEPCVFVEDVKGCVSVDHLEPL